MVTNITCIKHVAETSRVFFTWTYN